MKLSQRRLALNSPQIAEELWVDTEYSNPWPQPNIPKEEAKALKELKLDRESHTYCRERHGFGNT